MQVWKMADFLKRVIIKDFEGFRVAILGAMPKNALNHHL